MSICSYTHIQALSMDIFYIIRNIVDESGLRIQKLIRNGKLRVCDIKAVFRINSRRAFAGAFGPPIEIPTM